LSDAVYTLEDGRFVPSGHARGPWDPGAQHGGPPAALLVRAVEALEAPRAHAAEGGGSAMLLSRLTIEFLGPVPLAPLEVHAELVRPGKRLQLAEASIVADGREACRARAVRLRREPVAVPDPVRPPARIAGPDELQTFEMPMPLHGADESFARTAMELRFVEGTFVEPGPATAWFRLRMPLVAGEEPSPAQRLAAAGDFGNGIGAELEFDTHVFVNTDLTLHASREPVGEWIGLESRTEHGPEGTALAWSRLHDERGPVGLAAQSLYVAAR
jgi:hypothetical protein